jgi:glycosyltransferase involved in cell wall biosynthesis
LKALQACQGIQIVECGRWLPETFRLWSLMQANVARRAWTVTRLVLANLLSGFVALRHARKLRAPFYVPYPAIPLLWMFSFVPRRARPPLVADAYISLWDSLVVDRGGARTQGMFSKLLRAVEGRALRAADIVLTDTQANREYLIDIFAIKPSGVRSLPLAVVEPASAERHTAEPLTERNALEVLFVGTLVPLHGISNILLGIAPLVYDASFRFTVIGDGQDSERMDQFLQSHPGANVRWIREWQPPSELARWIESADVCLGVFGGAGKASRVLPLKLYLYLAHGCAVITQKAMSLPAGVPMPPLLTVESENPEHITNALQFLRANPEAVLRMQHDAARFYETHLSNARVVDIWIVLLQELATD